MHDRLNFSSFENSMLMMFRFSTGEGWDDIVTALGKDKNSISHTCIENPTYDDYVANGYKTIGCGNSFAIIMFFFTYLALMSLIFLNLYIAIILNGYYDARD